MDEFLKKWVPEYVKAYGWVASLITVVVLALLYWFLFVRGAEGAALYEDIPELITLRCEFAGEVTIEDGEVTITMDNSAWECDDSIP